jgi:hypothetical protein
VVKLSFVSNFMLDDSLALRFPLHHQPPIN